ncbi:A-kinase anchor protein 7-like isoform X1 [Saccostrea cucullata]|uniref:A-kinase anchor protein 7-like isoform X1 n=1 Tax=Saccostrea cuccullata TaxID=36930 RepID=UPI002ED34CE9
MAGSQSPNYFLAIQVSDEKIKENVQEVQSFMKKKNMNLSYTMNNLDTLHITLGLYRPENDEISEAKKALEEFQGSLNTFSPLTFTVSTIESFQDQEDPDDHDVVYAAVTDNQILKDLVGALRKSFQKRDLFVTDKGFVSHVTICRITARSRERGITRIDPSYYREKASTDFGKQHAKSIQLCSMGKQKSGYYHVEKEIYF